MSSTDKITEWLRRERRRKIALSVVCCLLAFPAGLFVVGLELLILTTLFSGLGVSITGSPALGLWIGGLIAVAILSLLSFDSFISNRDDMGNIALWMMREVCSFGPRLVQDSFGHFRRTKQFMALDAVACGIALGRLVATRKSVALTELVAASSLRAASLRGQLAVLDGVLILRADGSRLMVSEPLRLILSPLLRPQTSANKTSESEPETEPTPVQEPEKLSAHEILGVPANASLAAIKTAYRNRIKDCHPDRFAQMGEHARRQAEEWTKALNAAYAELIEQRRG